MVEKDEANKHTGTVLADELSPSAINARLCLNLDKACNDFRSHHK